MINTFPPGKRSGREVGVRVKDIDRIQDALSLKPACDDHAAIIEQREGMPRARRRESSRGLGEAACGRMVDFQRVRGRAGYFTTDDKGFSAFQQHCGGLFTQREHGTGRDPAIRVRMEDFGCIRRVGPSFPAYRLLQPAPFRLPAPRRRGSCAA